MKVEAQSTEELLGLLSRLEVDWQDETSRKAIERLKKIPSRSEYQTSDIKTMLSEDFGTGTLIARLFLGLSKDGFEATMIKILGKGRAGIKSYRQEPETYVAALVQIGLLEAMQQEVNRELSWYDVLLERLRSGRGSAVSGQKRGRFVEDFVEDIVQRVFGDQFDSRCNFEGQRGQSAKCDVAIPNRQRPAIVIEAKGYDATGSKMTDVIGDIEKIITVKRPDTAFMLFTDGISWMQRRSDFVKIVEYQNQGDITKIYTQKLAAAFEEDLQTLKREYGL